MDKSQKFVFQATVRTLSRLLEIYPTMSAQGFLVLSLVASRGEISMAEMQRISPITKAHVSRLISLLGVEGSIGKKGLGLVLVRDDPTNFSRKLVRLSPKGQSLIDELTQIMVQGVAPVRKSA